MKLVCGHGFNDGKYPTKVNSIRLRQYSIWRSVLYRCFNEKHHIKNPSYSLCSVSDNFKNYSYFYEWYSLNNKNQSKLMHLDKDLLIKGNKIYSEDTCLFLPQEINGTIHNKDSCRGKYPIGVYWATRIGKFGSCVRFKGKNQALGYFDNEIDAFNAYKEAKEFRIKQLADIYRSDITDKAYNALMNYTVEITD